MARILIVDDEENVLNAFRRAMNLASGKRYIIETFVSPVAALHRAKEGDAFDLVITDYRMPEMNGVEFLKSFMQIQPDAIRFILSGYADMEGLISAINEANIHRFINKPWQDAQLQLDIEHAIAYREIQAENKRLADQVRYQQGIISVQELELRRLEAESPGITKVKRREDGAVFLDQDDN